MAALFRRALPAAWILLLAILPLLAGCVLEDADSGATSCGEDHDEEAIAEAQNALSKFDCTESTDKGYAGGKAFPIKVVRIDGKKVELRTANAYYAMALAAEKAGVQIRIVSGFRTMAEQKYLYDCYKTCSCNSCNLAAKPGYSNHQSGHALDLNTSAPGVLSWLSKHAGKFGFKRTVPGEPWHWEWWGGGPGTAICGKLDAALLDASSDAEPVAARADEPEEGAGGGGTGSASAALEGEGEGEEDPPDYQVCAGEAFSFSFEFGNTGDLRWVDRGEKAEGKGQRVMLAAKAEGPDPLTGLRAISVSEASNADVRPEGYSKDTGGDCGEAKCRRTRFRAEELRAPLEPGMYATRWRLVDASPAWDEPAQFGPTAELRFRVVDCTAAEPKEPPAAEPEAPAAPAEDEALSGEVALSCALERAPAGSGDAAWALLLGLLALARLGARRADRQGASSLACPFPRLGPTAGLPGSAKRTPKARPPLSGPEGSGSGRSCRGRP